MIKPISMAAFRSFGSLTSIYLPPLLLLLLLLFLYPILNQNSSSVSTVTVPNNFLYPTSTSHVKTMFQQTLLASSSSTPPAAPPPVTAARTVVALQNAMPQKVSKHFNGSLI